MKESPRNSIVNLPRYLQMWSTGSFAACILIALFMIMMQLVVQTPSNPFEVSPFEIILDQGTKISLIVTALN